MAKYELKDESVAVIIGSGAGGGTLANELCQQGVNVVLLEAGICRLWRRSTARALRQYENGGTGPGCLWPWPAPLPPTAAAVGR